MDTFAKKELIVLPVTLLRMNRIVVFINVPSILEPFGIFRSDGMKLDRLNLIFWERGKALVWNAYFVDTIAASHIMGTSFRAREASKAAEVSEVSNSNDSVIFIDEVI